MQIAGFIKTSLIEWPGRIVSVIFVPGCNFRCPFCHNADIVADTERGLTLISENEILSDIDKRKKWIDGVVISGGEPALQKDLLKFLKILKILKLEIMVHTNGSKPKIVEKLIKEKLVDYWAMDIKGNFDEYEKYVGKIGEIRVIRERVKKTMGLIISSGAGYEFRTTVVPGLHNQENLICLAKQVKEILNTKYLILNTSWYLQQFRPINCLDKSYLKVKPFLKKQMEDFLNEIQKIIPQTNLRGV